MAVVKPKAKKKATAWYNRPYNPLASPFPTYQDMVNEANRRAGADIDSAIGGLTTPQTYANRYRSERADLGALSNATADAMQAVRAPGDAATASAGNLMGQAQAINAPQANAAVIGAGAPPQTIPTGNATAAALAATQNAAMAAPVQAQYQRGQIDTLAARHRYDDALAKRDADVAGLRAKQPALQGTYLDQLRGEAMQGATAAINRDIARMEFDKNYNLDQQRLTTQQDQFAAQQAQQAAQFGAGQDLNYAQLNEQQREFDQQMKYDLAHPKNSGANTNFRGTGLTPVQYRQAVTNMMKAVNAAHTRQTLPAGPPTPIVKHQYKHTYTDANGVEHVEIKTVPANFVPPKNIPGDPLGETPDPNDDFASTWEPADDTVTGYQKREKIDNPIPAQRLFQQQVTSLVAQGMTPRLAQQLALAYINATYGTRLGNTKKKTSPPPHAFNPER